MNENIKEIHDEVERMPFSQALFNGELTDHQIVAYMCNQWFIFQTMEDDVYRSLPHKSMKRCEKIKECVEEMGFEIDGKWMAKATKDYMNYIRGAEDYDEKWNSHVYLNYMAMLMGGSIISEKNPEMTWMWHFDDRTECIKSIRELNIDWDQVYQGFNYHRRMLEELNNVG